jgi:dockerin type I repeat protein
MKNGTHITGSCTKTMFSVSRSRIGPRAATLAVIALCQLQATVACATLSAGSTIVNSIGHSFEPENSKPGTGHPALVTDFLVNLTQQVDGGSTLASATVDLDTDTSISFTVAAPAGEKFVIRVPDGSSANMQLSLTWETLNPDTGSRAAFDASFDDLVGVAPSFPSSSFVGDNNQSFSFASTTPSFSGQMSFSSLTFTTTYSPRKLGLGPLFFQPSGSIAPFGTTARSANFVISYTTTGTADPGRFVSLIPDVLGDYNEDGVVNIADYTVWRDSLGQTGTGLAADGNRNGIVDDADFAIWETHFGQPGASGARPFGENSVPEPATELLLILGAPSLLLGTRRATWRTR